MSTSVWVRDVALPLIEIRPVPGTAGEDADGGDEGDEYIPCIPCMCGQASVVFCCVSQALLFFTDVEPVGLDS
jgi:hypothetical protein